MGAGSTPARAAPTTPANPYPGYTSDVYADPAHWVCRPDKADSPCNKNLDATAVHADGSTEIVRHQPATDAPIDCFYVYPTISGDPTPNSDLDAGPEEKIVTVSQAARLNSACQIYAPVYRQNTVASLLGRAGGDVPPAERRRIAYQDVLDAWKYYIATDNRGRGVILIGHSQGAGILSQLIAAEVDKVPELRNRLVSAMILGSGVTVPEGRDVGGSFTNIPLCRKADQIGCVINYSSFRATAPPPANSRFGRSDTPGTVVGCTNPAALGGGAAVTHPYFQKVSNDFGAQGGLAALTTDWITLPDFVRAECVFKDGASYLSITVLSNPDDPRADDVGGDLTPDWGLHLLDVTLAMGDLEDVAHRQAAAYTARSLTGH